jgi:hypothetical protein
VHGTYLGSIAAFRDAIASARGADKRPVRPQDPEDSSAEEVGWIASLTRLRGLSTQAVSIALYSKRITTANDKQYCAKK